MLSFQNQIEDNMCNLAIP